MARLRKNDNSLDITGSAAAAAAATRRATSPSARKRAASAVESLESASAAITETAAPIEVAIVPQREPVELESKNPGHDEIAALAYSYWIARGYADGGAEDDWLRAEADLRQRALPTL